MIPISQIEETAVRLMEKAAIEIPEDYLGGVRAAAQAETGPLCCFVLKTMLDNYDAAKEDRRAMCGDTGIPRWYVKMGNDARIEGGPVALECALRAGNRECDPGHSIETQSSAPFVAHRSRQQCRYQRTRDRICL